MNGTVVFLILLACAWGFVALCFLAGIWAHIHEPWEVRQSRPLVEDMRSAALASQRIDRLMQQGTQEALRMAGLQQQEPW